MELSTRLRGQIWRTQDWLARVVELEWEVKRITDPWERSERAFELGGLCEALIPDRDRAVSLYRIAWQATGDQLPALTRARRLYLEMRKLEEAAKLAEIEYEATSDPTVLAIAGETWLDAGERERAAAALERASRELSGDEDVGDALAVAAPGSDSAALSTRLQKEAKAAADPRVTSRKLLHAALVLRAHHPRHPRFEELLRASLEEDPRNERSATLLEMLLEEEEKWIEFIELHELRGDTATSDRERVDIYRRGGMALAVRHQQTRPGARMIATALSVAYDQNLETIGGHLAMLSVLRNAYQATGQLAQAAKIYERALEAPLSEDERLFVASLAGRTRWKALKDPEGARPFFATVKSIVPDHPLVLKFERTTGQSLTEVPRRREAEEYAQQALVERELEMAQVTTRPYLSDGGEGEGAPQRERRAHVRHPFSEVVKVQIAAPVEVTGAGAAGFRAQTRDLSEGGLFIESARSVPAGAELRIILRVPRSQGWEPDLFDLRGRVVRQEDHGFGVEISEPSEAYRERVRGLAGAPRRLGV